MGDERLYHTFKHDTRGFIDQIKELLIKLESSGYSSDIINQIFRCIHSIKSEADYLDFTEIASVANDMESAVERLRRGERGELSGGKLIEFCSTAVEKIDSLLSFTEPPIGVLPVEPDGNEQKMPEGKYSDFELLLLRDAYARGEKLYEVSFGISAQEVMKYPRVYLAMNNLELNHNVIKMVPGPDEIRDALPDRIRVVLTSGDDEEKIGSDIAVDQIEAIAVFSLDFEAELKNVPLQEGVKEPLSVKTQDRGIHVDVSEIDAISEYVSQIKGRLSGLTSAFSEKDKRGELESDLAGLERISENIENLMVNLKTVDFNSYFSSYKRTVKNIAAKLGKKAELYFDENSARIDKEFADYIAEPILQLLRNAVAHGIEEPKAREAAGKGQTGRIDISIIKDGEDVMISVEDDGSGISVEAGTGDEEILERIVVPGFTTLSPADKYAGRGVGLDLVKSGLEQRNGRLEFKNQPGAGCEFTMIFTDRDDDESYTIVRDGTKTFSVRNVETAEIVSIQTGLIEERAGRYLWRTDELYTWRGRLQELPENREDTIHGVRISHQGAVGILVFDEALFEVNLKKSSCSTGSETEKYLSEFQIDGKRADYDILRPEVLFD